MKPLKLSPWTTSKPGARPGVVAVPEEGRPVRYWLPQPMWFRGPAMFLVVIIMSASFLNMRFGAGGPMPLVWFGVAILLSLGLGLASFSGRVVLEPRGLFIRRLADDRFIPYRQLGSIFLHREDPTWDRQAESYLELTLSSGERVRLEVGDLDAIRRGILTAQAAWRRTLDDDEPSVPERRDAEGSPYRGAPER